MNLTGMRLLSFGGVPLRTLAFDGIQAWGMPVTIVFQTESFGFYVGDTVTLHVEATGAKSYQWQCEGNSGWMYLGSIASYNPFVTATATFTALASSEGLYRCEMTGYDGNVVYSEPIDVTRRTDATIITQPETIKCQIGDSFVVSVTAKGAISYEWQYCNPAVSAPEWKRLTWTGWDSAEMTGEMTAARAGFLYRCKITGEDGVIVYTDVVGVTLVSDVVITQQPVDAIGTVGDTISFSVTAENAASYQWQYSNDGGEKWGDLTWDGATTSTLTGTLNSSRVKFLYRCEILDAGGNPAYTDIVKIVEAT